MATGPFYDTMPGPLRRDTLNEMWGVWQDAIGSIIKGDAGWSPLIRSVQDGDRVVLEVYDWVGGQGAKPIQTGFLGSTGFVATAALAIDIRGPQGLQGIQGVKGDTGLTGDKGDAATISVGAVTTSTSDLPASVTNSGTSSAAVFDFSIPQGEKGDTGSSGTISVGTTTTVPEGSSASVTNTGTPSAAVLNFSIPKGDKGDAGTAATIAVGAVTTGAPGTSVVVTNSGTSGAAILDFTIPRGEDGAGAGDMRKADYDSVGDGVVDASRSTPWSGVTGKPDVIAAGADAASARLVIEAASSVELTAGLGTKVDKVVGKSLSTEDFTTAEKSKLAGVAEGATSNQTDVFLLDRTNHTGSQAISTVTGLQDLLNAKQEKLVSGTNLKTINGESILGSGDLAVGGGGSSGPTLQGDTAPYVTQTKTYQITNYNSFSIYAVSTSAGTASLSGDTITFTAPASAGNVSLTLTVDGQPTAFTVVVQPAGVATPTNTSPADGAVNIDATPTLQSSAFVAHGLADTHLASRWTVYQGGTQVHSSGWRTDALTSYTVPAGVVTVSTAYTWTVEHQGNSLGNSPASTATSFTTATSFNSYITTPTATPANFGDALDGGFYAGMVWNELVQSATSTTIGTGSKSLSVPNMNSAPIVYAGQQLEVRSRANPANKMVGTVTGASGTNLTINVTSVGGSGTFTDWSIMSRYRVIVAPKASGEHAGIALKNANTALPTACQTLAEGLRATQSMRDADTSTVYPAAHWARGLNIGGRTDWYIPARDELELCWRNLKPTTTANYVAANRPTAASFNYANNGSYGDAANTHGTNNNSSPTGAAYTASVPGQTAATAFRTGGAEAYEFGSAYYWSSSDYNASYAWFQNWGSSYPGTQDGNGKTNTYRVRAIRRSIV